MWSHGDLQQAGATLDSKGSLMRASGVLAAPSLGSPWAPQLLRWRPAWR